MLKVSLDELQQLLPTAGEAELVEGGDDDDLGLGLTFKLVVQKWEEYHKRFNVIGAYKQLTQHVLAQKCPPIKLVGEGSSRTAFACVGGKCLKVAKKEAGCAQNQQEAKHTLKKWWQKKWDCFVKTYGISRGNALLLSECVAPVQSSKQLCEALGASSQMVLNAALWALTKAEGASFDVAVTAKSLKSKCSQWRSGRGERVNGMSLGKDDIKAVEDAAFWLEAVARKKLPGHRTFLQIVEFWKKNGVDELLPGDVAMAENWGFAIRSGQIAPVMLDVGFSKDVADEFY